MFVETCPHYLTHNVAWSGGAIGKVNPPLRTACDRAALWAAVLSGAVDTIATDHVHRDMSAKSGGIWSASPGCPGLETLLPVLLSEGHHKRGLGLARIVELVSANPARLMGLDHRKGSIAPGMDADFAIVDLDAVWKPARDSVISSAGYSLYEDTTFRGRVLHTLVRGKAVLRDMTLEAIRVGTGRYVRRHLRPPAQAATAEFGR